MWATLAKYVGGKVLTAVLIVASLSCAFWFYKHPDDLRTLWGGLKGVLVWLGFVMILPWALFFVPSWIVKRESNAAAALMLSGYLLVDILAAMYLAGWGVSGALTWMVLILGFLAAGVYNFMVCDFQAGRAEESV